MAGGSLLSHSCFVKLEFLTFLQVNDTCELCGSTVKVQVHHIRAMKDLRTKGRAKPPIWVEMMATLRRKTLVVCASCHVDIRTGRPLP